MCTTNVQSIWDAKQGRHWEIASCCTVDRAVGNQETHNRVRPWLYHSSVVGYSECHRHAVPTVCESAFRHQCRLVPGLWAGAGQGLSLPVLVAAHGSHLSKQQSLEVDLCLSQGLKVSSSQVSFHPVIHAAAADQS